MARPRMFEEEAVVAAARDQFRSAGYAATSIDDLVTATGLSRGSLYGALGDKHQTYMRALNKYCADSMRNYRDTLEGPDAGALKRLGEHVRDIAEESGDNPVGCFLAGATAERGATDPEVAALAKRIYRQWEDMLVTALTQAQRQGDLTPGMDPQAVGAMLLITLRGMEALGKAGRNRDFMHRIADHSLTLLNQQTPHRSGKG